MSNSVAYNRVPFADQDGVTLIHQESGQIVEPIAERNSFGILEFAFDDLRFAAIPWETLKDLEIITLGVDLQKINVAQALLLAYSGQCGGVY